MLRVGGGRWFFEPLMGAEGADCVEGEEGRKIGGFE